MVSPMTLPTPSTRRRQAGKSAHPASAAQVHPDLHRRFPADDGRGRGVLRQQIHLIQVDAQEMCHRFAAATKSSSRPAR